MIYLKTLQWSNMFSYGENNILDLSSEPVTQILGLNGHGKSSIPLILEEVLYNKNSKGIKKGNIINRNINSNKYSAILSINIGTDEYLIKLSRAGATQKVALIKNGTDISSHTATDTFRQIEDLLGLDFKTFSQIVYQNNSSSLQFLTATDTNRKKFLIDLLSLERYIHLFDKIKVLHKEITESLIKAQNSVALINSWIDKNSTIKAPMELVVEPEVDTSKKTTLDKLKLDLSNIVAINKKIQQNEQYKQLRDSIDPSTLVTEYTQVDTSVFLEKLGALKNKKNELTNIKNKFSNIKEGECPTCYQPVNIDSIKAMADTAIKELEMLEADIKKYSDAIKEAEVANNAYKSHQKLVMDFEKYSALIDSSMPTILLSRGELEEEIARIDKEIKEQMQEVLTAKEHNKTAIEHNAKLELIASQLEEQRTQLNKELAKLSELDNKVGVLEVLKKTFSTNGLLAYKIENSVKDLQTLTNYYLTELSDGRFQLNFEINNDKLNVVIVDNGQEVEITALSAGELARVTTATLLAIRKLMSSISKARINTLFLDETIDVLDTYGKEKLIEVLLKEDGLNTFLISHGYSHPLIKKVVAVKEDGISRLEDG